MKTIFRADPACRCNTPGKAFCDEQEARSYARRSADASRVAFVVWSVLAGRPKRLAAYSPNPARA